MVRKWNRYTRAEIREIILNLLKENRYGLTITEISRELKLTPRVARREVNKLKEKDKIKIRKVGPCKIIYKKCYYRR
ncbi:MAG: HTH domain-containing protein [Candidatus Njordarchaeales archaeon]